MLPIDRGIRDAPTCTDHSSAADGQLRTLSVNCKLGWNRVRLILAMRLPISNQSITMEK